MPGLLDVVLVALIVVAVPLDARGERRRLQTALADGVPDARLRAYRRIIAWQWGAAAVLLTIWVVTGRSVSLLGIATPNGRGFVIALVIALAITALLRAQVQAVASQPQAAEQVRAAAASLTFLLPATAGELRRFTWLGITAGIVEELVYRGYLMWCIGALAPTWVALVASSLAFGLGHLYQGVNGVAKTAAVGLVVGGLYLVSGSIWVPMFVHGVIDVMNGKMVYSAMRSAPDVSR